MLETSRLRATPLVAWPPPAANGAGKLLKNMFSAWTAPFLFRQGVQTAFPRSYAASVVSQPG